MQFEYKKNCKCLLCFKLNQTLMNKLIIKLGGFWKKCFFLNTTLSPMRLRGGVEGGSRERRDEAFQSWEPIITLKNLFFLKKYFYFYFTLPECFREILFSSYREGLWAFRANVNIDFKPQQQNIYMVPSLKCFVMNVLKCTTASVVIIIIIRWQSLS